MNDIYPDDVDLNDYLISGEELAASDVKEEWLIDGVIPEHTMVTLTGPAGVAKTALVHTMASAISKGKPWHGRRTKRTRVAIIDYENPKARDAKEARLIDLQYVYFLLASDGKVIVPKIDGLHWERLMRINAELIIIDGFRMSLNGDENSSKDVALAISHYRDMVNAGKTLIILHHPNKSNERGARGSGAFVDLPDHPLYFHAVRKIGDDTPVETLNYNDPNLLFVLRTFAKSRSQQTLMYLKRMGDYQFEEALSPQDQKLDDMRTLLLERNFTVNQSSFISICKSYLNIDKTEAMSLFTIGEQEGYWTTSRGAKNALIYTPQSQSFSVSSPIGRRKTGKQTTTPSDSFPEEEKTEIAESLETLATTEFASFPRGAGKQRKQKLDSESIQMQKKPENAQVIDNTEFSSFPEENGASEAKSPILEDDEMKRDETAEDSGKVVPVSPITAYAMEILQQDEDDAQWVDMLTQMAVTGFGIPIDIWKMTEARRVGAA